MKKILVPTFMAILFGVIMGRILFRTYKNDLYSDMNSSKLYLLQSGEYTSIDDMREKNNKDNYIYYKDKNKYKIVVGVTSKVDNLNKIKKLYDNNVGVEEYYVPNDLLLSKQIEYDNELSLVDDSDKVKEIVSNILSLYKEDDAIRLVSMN